MSERRHVANTRLQLATPLTMKATTRTEIGVHVRRGSTTTVPGLRVAKTPARLSWVSTASISTIEQPAPA
jgi:hypothetical protein